MRKLRLAILLLCGIGFCGWLPAWAEADPERDCPASLVCFTIPEAQGLARNLINAKQEQLRLEAKVIELAVKKPRRLGFTLGCGLGVGYDFAAAGAELQPACGLYYGVRF